MLETVEEMKQNYEENLKPHDYQKAVTGFLTEMDNLAVPSLAALYKLMKSGRFKGQKLLEIGSGATVHNIASASAYFKEIVQSDFVEANCIELRKWLKGESDLDWSLFLEAVAKIEGFADLNSGREEIEERIRKSVKSVVHCDLLKDEVIPEEVTTEYDLIVTSLTLEAAATDLDSYVTILKRLNRLLRPGGGLVHIGFLNGGRWQTDGGDFHHIKVSQEDVDQALERAGFIEKDWLVIPKTKESPLYEYSAYFFVASQKA